MQATTTKKLFTTAVVISPPESQWTPIQNLRRQYDKAFNRWMPHINLIFPFVAPNQFESAARTLSEALKNIPPFVIKFDSFRHFDHGNSSVVWLHPDVDKIVELQATIVKAFPFCDDQNKKSASGFTPHLTVGQFSTKSVAPKILEFTKSSLPSIQEFEVTHIDFISRDGDVPFEVLYTVSLGGGFKKITRRAAVNDVACRVFVGGVDKDTTSQDLQRIFEEAGYSVEKAFVPMGKPFGFVTLKTAEEQARAVKQGVTGFNVKPANS